MPPLGSVDVRRRGLLVHFQARKAGGVHSHRDERGGEESHTGDPRQDDTARWPTMIDEISQTRPVGVHLDERPRIAATLAELAESGYSALSLDRRGQARRRPQDHPLEALANARAARVEGDVERAGEHISVPDTASL